MSGPPNLPELDPLAVVDEQARPPALPQDPDDEADPQGAPRHLRLQVEYPQRRGTGTHDGEPTEQGEQVPQLRTPRPQHKGRT